MTKKVLITGGQGFIGRNLVKGLKDEFEIISISRLDFDLTNRQATDEYFKNKKFDIVIHTAIKGGSRFGFPNDPYVLEDNLMMYYNLLANQSQFKKFINLGSGAEIGYPTDSYGLSKYIIRESILSKPNFYNLRLFGVFGGDELDTRFIKSNIKRYINDKPLIIHQDKLMDFFYIDDLVELIRYYILNKDLLKETDCVYSSKYSLREVISKILSIEGAKGSITSILNLSLGIDYIGKADNIIPYIGLEEGIKRVYNKLKND